VRERDAEKSRQAILLAAEAEFAEKGFFGARVDEIADRAQINKRMIYAYFGDKKGLYKQVLFLVYTRLELVDRAVLASGHRGPTLIREIIGAYFDFLRDNPTVVSILLWENLHRGAYLKELENGRIERDTIRHFAALLEAGKAEGVFKKEIDSWHTVLSLITVCFANFSNQYTLSKLFGRDLTDAAQIEERKQFTADMMVAYLCGSNEGGQKDDISLD